LLNLPLFAVAGEEDAISLGSSVGAVSLEALDEEIRSLMWRTESGLWACACCDKRSKAGRRTEHEFFNSVAEPEP
jgi:hypothetical protein